MVIHLSRHKILDGDPKAIQQIEFVGQLENPDNEIVTNFVLTIFEKIKIFSRKCNSIINNTKLSGNTQIHN